MTLGRSGIATYGNPFTPETLVALPRFIVDGMATALGAAVGGGALLGRVLSVALVAWIAWLAVKRRPIPTRAIACLLAIVAEYTIVGIVRAQLEVDASLYTRYAYLSGILALIALASLLGRPEVPVARRPILVAVGVAVLVFSLAWNVRLLLAGRDLYAERADLTRALVTLGTTDPLPAGVDPGLSLVLVPSPVELRDVIERYGSPMHDSLAPGAVPAVSEAARAEALRRALDPARLAPRAAAQALASRRCGPCLRHRGIRSASDGSSSRSSPSGSCSARCRCARWIARDATE